MYKYHPHKLFPTYKYLCSTCNKEFSVDRRILKKVPECRICKYGKLKKNKNIQRV